MELASLSSNWKKLQQTLQQESQATTKKRPAAYTTVSTRDERSRRREAKVKGTKDTKPSPSVIERDSKRLKMGNGNSVPEVSSGSRPGSAAKRASWAEETNTAQDVGLASGQLSRKSSSIALGDIPQVNAGLNSSVEVGKYLAIDCEMVGVGGDENERSVLARVSIVNFHGHQVYDSFVKPREFVTNWRTSISGVSSRNMETARSFDVAQKDIAALLKDRIIVGHAIGHDLDALFLSHPKRDIRDTSKHAPFRRLAAGRTPSLKKLAKEILGVDIQGGEHSSVEDARVSMLLFRQHKDAFEADHLKRNPDRASPNKYQPRDANVEGSTRSEKGKKKKRKKK